MTPYFFKIDCELVIATQLNNCFQDKLTSVNVPGPMGPGPMGPGPMGPGPMGPSSMGPGPMGPGPMSHGHMSHGHGPSQMGPSPMGNSHMGPTHGSGHGASSGSSNPSHLDQSSGYGHQPGGYGAGAAGTDQQSKLLQVDTQIIHHHMSKLVICF